MGSAPRRGEVYWVDFSPTRGSEQAGRRPAVIVSNETANRNSSVVIVVPTSTRLKAYPWNVHLPAGQPLSKESMVLCNQLRTVAKERLEGDARGRLSPSQMASVEVALRLSLGM